jgi:hypothetical protein
MRLRRRALRPCRARRDGRPPAIAATAGTPLADEGERWPDEVYLLVTTRDDPGALPPRGHVYVGRKLPWVRLADGLPRYRTTAGESGPMTEDE